MKLILSLLLGILLLAFLGVACKRAVNGRRYKISSKSGLQESGYVLLGGIEQYLQIRGQDRSQPVMLVLHGGPGSPMTDYSYGWQTALEEVFTVVHWEQRGCGNTYFRNPQAPKPTLELLLSDLDELVQQLCSRFGQEKVVLFGHSWGTLLGSIYTGAHPDRVSVYISVSQMLDLKKSELLSTEEAVRLACAAGRKKDGARMENSLKSLLSCQRMDRQGTLELLRLRQKKERYLPSQYSGIMTSLRLFSPDMTVNGFRWMLSFSKLIEENTLLYEALLSGEKKPPLDYQIPVLLIAGEQDWTTPYPMVREYFGQITAPYGEFITIKGTGHIPFVDRPEEFCSVVLEALKRTEGP